MRWIKGTAKQGLHRASWDLKLSPPDPINLSQPAFKPPWAGDAVGPLVAPGNYSVALYLAHEGTLVLQGAPQAFKVKPVSNSVTDFNAVATFQQKTSELSRQISSAGRKLNEAGDRLKHLKAALLETPKASEKLFADWNQLQLGLAELQSRLYGDSVRRSLDESISPSIRIILCGMPLAKSWACFENDDVVTKTPLFAPKPIRLPANAWIAGRPIEFSGE